MTDPTLSKIIATGTTFNRLKFRILVVAWGRTIEGTVITADEYAEGLAKSLTAAMSGAQQSAVAVQIEAARKEIVQSIDGERTDRLRDLHLAAVTIDGRSGTVERIRIPLSDIVTYAFLSKNTVTVQPFSV